MRRDNFGSIANAGPVVHVVGQATHEVFSFLGPASTALARRGVEQVVVMIDEPRNRPHLSRLHDSVRLVLVPSAGNSIKQLRALLQAARSALAARSLHAVHVHGLLPGFVSAGVARAAGRHVPIFYSPQGSRSFAAPRSIGALGRWLFKSPASGSRSDALIDIAPAAPAFDQWKPVLFENPVADAFFATPRLESQLPLIVAGGRGNDAHSAAHLAQLAVLLGGEPLGISFNWIGSVDATSQARLKAANVGMFDAPIAFDRAARFAAAWIYVAPAKSRGFKCFLAEAMAAGVPCVALDSREHRELIRDGETGFLCKLERDMIPRIATLVDSPALRARIGQAARAEAKRRFGEDRFSTRLLSTYDLPS